MKPRTLWDCQPVMAIMALSLAPAGCFSSVITRAAFVSARATAGSTGGVGAWPRPLPLSPPEAACAPTWGACRSMALQIRLTPVCRSVNLAIFRTPGRLFQISTRRPFGQCAASAANCFSLVNRAASPFQTRSVEVDTAMVLLASMVNIRMPLESSL
jgi:hypothetical protein